MRSVVRLRRLRRRLPKPTISVGWVPTKSCPPITLKSSAGTLGASTCCSTAPALLDWVTLLQTVRPGGTLCFVATPPGVVTFPAQLLVTQQRTLSGSDIGSRSAMADMLRFAADHNIAPLIETRPMVEVNEAIERVRRNDARYRVVLTA